MREEGYREAMVGNISLYDVTGKRQHTIYLGEAPEYGKGTLRPSTNVHRLEKEISRIKNYHTLMHFIWVLPMVQKIILMDVSGKTYQPSAIRLFSCD